MVKEVRLQLVDLVHGAKNQLFVGQHFHEVLGQAVFAHVGGKPIQGFYGVFVHQRGDFGNRRSAADLFLERRIDQPYRNTGVAQALLKPLDHRVFFGLALQPPITVRQQVIQPRDLNAGRQVGRIDGQCRFQGLNTRLGPGRVFATGKSVGTGRQK